MEYANSRFSVLVTRVQHNFIWMVLAAYALAGFFVMARLSLFASIRTNTDFPNAG